MEVTCNKCGETCEVEGDYPKFLSWCDTCNDYPAGFDPHDVATDYMSHLIDQAKERRKYGP